MGQWKIDATHSEVSFKVKHLVVSTVTGKFGAYNATIESATDDFRDAKITFEADVTSLSTNDEQRDNHLKSADFFDAAAHPKVRFVSTSVRKISDHELAAAGELTLRGITRPVTLDVIYNGTVAGFHGTQVAGFEVRGRVNRFDFGLRWNALTEAGGVVVGNDVRIEILAEFVKVQSAAKAA